ncbi:N-acetylneuraminate synthase [Roseateles sp. DC23W]|uniref:N-acetylneuraminate synthase n=1 Tax=Pelomonas dachongensis TaxID=3299029 RepID=A0ABW7EQS6_9BURK
MDQTLVIAEIGVNHNGDIGLAKEMIAAARETGVDVVKFQTYKAEEVMTDETPLAGYMKDGDKNFLELARRLELSFDETLTLQAYAKELGIEFLSSPFDVPSTDFLGTIGMRRMKIPSGETVNPFLLRAAAATRLPLIVSTGMATLEEVRRSLDFLKRHDSGPVTVLHCTTQYPAEPQYCNLRAMATMAREFGLPVGYSDHTPGIEISLAAVALGATVIEKHFTLDKKLPGPDQAASLEPHEFRALVDGIRNINAALGHGEKRPWPVEVEVAKVARKSIVTVRAMDAGHVITEADLTAKRPGTGIPAMDAELVFGRTLARDVAENALIRWTDLA